MTTQDDHQENPNPVGSGQSLPSSIPAARDAGPSASGARLDEGADDVQKGLLRLEDGRELEAELITGDRVVIRAYSGPLPPASELGDYNNVVENGAERIVRQFEAESDTSRKLREALTSAHIKGRTRGQYMAFATALACFGIAAFAIFMNQPWVAALFGAATFGNSVFALLRDGGVDLPGFRRRQPNDDEGET